MNDELEKQAIYPEAVRQFTFFASVQMNGVSRPYYFGTEDDSLETGEAVIVDTVTGFELGTIVEEPRSTDEYQSTLPLKEIVRRAGPNDFKMREYFDSKTENALKICDEEAKYLKLDMRFLTLHYSVDGSKCTITYSSDNRVDFRELLKVLAPKLNARIDLRQVAPRDRAKNVGGVGICGLPLCCASFLTHFDVISISKAKNQMLSLNIPKLSGACGKLMCCLAYEDELYTEEKAKFPKIGTTVTEGRTEYRVDSINILSRTIKLTSKLDTKFLTLEEFQNIGKPKPKKEENPFPEIDIRVDNPQKKNNGTQEKGHEQNGQNHENNRPHHNKHRNRNRHGKGNPNNHNQK